MSMEVEGDHLSVSVGVQLTKIDYLEKRVTFLESKSRAQDQKIGKLMTELENVKLAINYPPPTKENDQAKAKESADICYPDVNLCEKSNFTKNQDLAGTQKDKIIKVNLEGILKRPVKMGESSTGKTPITSSSSCNIVNTETETESDDQIPNENENEDNFINVGEMAEILMKTEPEDLEAEPNEMDMDYGFSGSEAEENEVSNKHEHEQTKSHICPFCQKSFVSKSHLERHKRSHTGERPFQCTICPKSFSHKHNLKTHIEIHEGVKPFSCAICSRSFSFNAHLKDHFMKLHSETFSCSVCSKNFSSEKTKKIHELTHTDLDFECPICKKKFTLQHFLNGHMKREHSMRDEDINNAFLDQNQDQDIDQVQEPPEFLYSEDFASPVEENEAFTNTNQSPVCSKSLTRSQSQVQVSQGNDKPFVCDICSKTFASPGNLNGHIKHVHMNERPHACTICPKTFTYSGHLSDHIQSVHSEEKLFSCPICFKKISRKRDLGRHLETHSTSSSRPFECDICKKSFAVEATLANHIKRSHSIYK